METFDPSLLEEWDEEKTILFRVAGLVEEVYRQMQQDEEEPSPGEFFGGDKTEERGTGGDRASPQPEKTDWEPPAPREGEASPDAGTLWNSAGPEEFPGADPKSGEKPPREVLETSAAVRAEIDRAAVLESLPGGANWELLRETAPQSPGERSVQITVNNYNTVAGDVDVDRLCDTMARRLREELEEAESAAPASSAD